MGVVEFERFLFLVNIWFYGVGLGCYLRKYFRFIDKILRFWEVKSLV